MSPGTSFEGMKGILVSDSIQSLGNVWGQKFRPEPPTGPSLDLEVFRPT